MKSQELISILLPAYNVASYINDAVCSILSQTYRNIELIVVDDCSSDGTYEILQCLAAKDSRIQLYRNEKNSRIVTTLNYALSKARGLYIARMDGDDISSPDRLEKLKKYLDDNPECGIVGSFSAAIDSNGGIIAQRMFPVTDKAIKLTLNWCSTIQHIWLARKEVYIDLGGYREFPGAEDYDFLLRAARQGYGLANYPECLYFVRLRQGNTESTEGLKRVLTKKCVAKLAGKETKNTEAFLEEYVSRRYTPSAAGRYKDASNCLNDAKHNRRHRIKLFALATKAALTSRYMLEYLFEVIVVRIVARHDIKKTKEIK